MVGQLSTSGIVPVSVCVLCKQGVTAADPGSDASMSPCPLGCRRAIADTSGDGQGLRTSLSRSHQAAAPCPLYARLRTPIQLPALSRTGA